MLTGNKGEWSEIYTLLKLIADGKMLKGNKDLKPVANESYKVIALERKESRTGNTSYLIKDNILEVKNSNESVTIERALFSSEANKLLDEIKSQSGTFEIPSTQLFMEKILTFSIKAKSQDKSDIKVEIQDHRTSIEHTRGFSIKSQLGSASSLLNASQHTTFKYKLENLDAKLAAKGNAIKGKGCIIKRVQFLSKLYDVFIKKMGPCSKEFFYNLTLTDDALPDITANLIWQYYEKNESKIDKLITHTSAKNIRQYEPNDADVLYTIKLKRFLVSVALGMKPSKKWDGLNDATGGYLIVLKTGELISYHIYDRNDFEEYLFHNTKLETPSSSRYNIGTIYEENDSYFINLNLQIRFCQ